MKSGFSITELMIAMTLFILTIGAMISCHLFGLRLMYLVQPDAGNVEEAMTVVKQLSMEVQAARYWQVGSGSATKFTEIPVYKIQQGNALQIYTTNSSTIYIRYYRDPSDRQLKRLTETFKTPVVVTEAIENDLIFSAEDMAGNTLASHENGPILALSWLLNRRASVLGTNAGPFELDFKIRTRASD